MTGVVMGFEEGDLIKVHDELWEVTTALPPDLLDLEHVETGAKFNPNVEYLQSTGFERVERGNYTTCPHCERTLPPK